MPRVVVHLALVRQIVDRCHVGQSNLQVIRYFISRLRGKRAAWNALTRADRRRWMKAIIRVHADNRVLYNAVMTGTLKRASKR